MQDLPKIKRQVKEFLNSDTTSATLTKVMLAVIALGGLLAVGAIAPNLVQLLAPYLRKKKYSSKQIYNAYSHLRHNGLIKVRKQKDGKVLIGLTEKGEKKLADLDLDNLTIIQPKGWDKKWRVLIFDLPVRFRKSREALRYKIKDLGFIQLQKSVWVYPYPCEEELIFIAEFFNITKYIEILTVEKILREAELKKHFGL